MSAYTRVHLCNFLCNHVLSTEFLTQFKTISSFELLPLKRRCARVIFFSVNTRQHAVLRTWVCWRAFIWYQHIFCPWWMKHTQFCTCVAQLVLLWHIFVSISPSVHAHGGGMRDCDLLYSNCIKSNGVKHTCLQEWYL